MRSVHRSLDTLSTQTTRYRGTPAHRAVGCAHIDRRSRGHTPARLRPRRLRSFLFSFFLYFDLGQRLVTLDEESAPPINTYRQLHLYARHRTATRTVDIVRRRRSYARAQSTHSSEKSDELRPSLRDTSLMPQHTWSPITDAVGLVLLLTIQDSF